MQSKATRGVRRLLVSTGVISLVLSVAAPSALAARSADAGTPGAQLVNVCHNGKVLQMEQAALQAHLDHGDFAVDVTLERGDDCSETGRIDTGGETPGTLVKVCRNNEVAALTQAELDDHASEIDGSVTGLDDLDVGAPCGDPVGVIIGGPGEETDGASLVDICHDGEVLAVEEHAVDGHLAHGDGVVTADAPCAIDPIEDDDAVGGGAPVGGGPVGGGPVGGGPAGGDAAGGDPAGSDPSGGGPVGGGTDPVEAVEPEPQVDVMPGAEEVPPAVEGNGPEPLIIISTDTVTKPAPAVTPAVPGNPTTPASPAVARTPEPEVLGSITTRTPGVAGSTVTRTGVTALAATGTSTTTVLAVIGSVLLLAGLGLQLVARRHTDRSALRV